MWMYSKRDIKNIVEDFFAEHFNFSAVYLNEESTEELEKICLNYGIDVEGIVEQ